MQMNMTRSRLALARPAWSRCRPRRVFAQEVVKIGFTGPAVAAAPRCTARTC